MTVCLVLTACGMLCLPVYIREKTRRYSLKAVFWKTLISFLFVSVGAFASRCAPDTGRTPCTLVLLGLCLGMLGDIWLDLKYVYRQDDQALTVAGFFVFGAGHVLYMGGLLLRYARPGALPYLLIPALLAVLASAAVVLTEKPMKLRYGKMKPVVAAYGFLLFGTVFLSGSLALMHGWQERALNFFFAGAVLFALSDLILSGTYFGEGKERPIDLTLNYLTYFPAQYLIALSLLFA